MTLSLFERPGSRSMSADPPSLTTQWGLTGTTDHATALATIISGTPDTATSPAGLLYRQDVQMQPAGYNLWYATIPYGVRKNQLGSYRLAFDTTGGTIHIANSKETISKNAATGVTAPDFKQLIGVRGDEVEGTEIVIPALKITVNFKHPIGIVSLARIKLLSQISGTVNSTSFLTFAAGEVLFLGASGSEGTDAETEVSYSFAMSQNVTGMSIGEIVAFDKKGWEAVWISYKDATDSAGGVSYAVKQPEFAYVERVYETTDLAAVLGFG